MYITPNSTLELFPDIGLSGNYDNSLYFASTSEKDAHFSTIPKIATISNLYYVSSQKGVIRIGVKIKNILSAGYLRFKNTSFENKWFYAFITDIQYKNNEMTEIHFDIDYLMTWMGTFQLKQCFVERQHVESDEIGVNVLDEGLNYGEHIIENVYDYAAGTGMNLIIIVTSAEKGEGGGIEGGIYSGCQVKAFTTADLANSYIEELIDSNKQDNIVKIYTIPTRYFPNGKTAADRYISSKTNPKPYTSLNGYVPKNNKLFCYPYKFVEASNSEGDRKDFKYECFNTTPGHRSSGYYTFSEQAYYGASTQAVFIPMGYADESKLINANVLNTDQRLSITNFPLCSYNVDTYRAYTAQVNSSAPNSLFNGFASGAIHGATSGGAIGGLAGAALGAISGGLSNIAGTAINLLSTKTFPVEMGTRNQGTQESDFLLATNNKGFRLYEKCITSAYAKIIDDYFSAFGYAIREVKVPNMNARPHWTFVKTLDCCITGNLPSDDARKIEQIFNSGCRFWKKYTEIGNYSLDNSPE